MKLLSILKDRNNGLTQSRIILSFFVLFDHQYALLQVPRPKFLSGPLTLSSFAVFMFIFMSGLLCFVSRQRNSAPRFLLLRFARIFPGYAVCLAISSLLVIPLLASLAKTSHILPSDLGTSTIRASLDYFFGNLAFTQNIYMPATLKINLPVLAINGSLWTLQPEIMGYLLIALFFPLFILIPRFLVLLFGLAASLLAIMPGQLRIGIHAIAGGYGFETGTDSHLFLAVYLLSGIIYAIYASHIDINSRLGCLFIGLLIAAYHFDSRAFNLISPVILPYTFIYSCSAIKWPWGPRLDFSYGVYLYSFPVQQITWSLQQHKLMPGNFFLSLCFVVFISVVFGIFSFCCIENPCRAMILSLMPAKK
jgi:peptidoglycan/LPS O-acetylase OafA/YrhL